MASHLITNKLRLLFPYVYNERGNCTYWTSSGLVKIGMLDSNSNFPLACFYKLLLNIYLCWATYFETSQETKEHCIVLYKGINHDTLPKSSFMYPMYWLKHGYNAVCNVQKIANLKFILTKISDEKYDIEVKYSNPEKSKQTLISMLEYIKNIYK